MKAEAAFRFGIVAEANLDAQVARDLAVRVLESSVDWFDASTCRWHGADPDVLHLTWKSVTKTARERGIAKHGKFRGNPGACDARRARLALRLFLALDDVPDAVVLVRDTDAKVGHTESLRLTQSEFSAFPVALAIPNPKMECWILAGFEPQDAEETTNVEQAHQHLGFDPRVKNHRLTTQGKKGKKNAKKVLESLTTDWQRKCDCWQVTDLALLEERCSRSGLPEYLADVRHHLVPIVTSSG